MAASQCHLLIMISAKRTKLHDYLWVYFVLSHDVVLAILLHILLQL